MGQSTQVWKSLFNPDPSANTHLPTTVGSWAITNISTSVFTSPTPVPISLFASIGRLIPPLWSQVSCSGASVADVCADVCASRVDLLVVVIGTDVDADVVAGAVVAVVASVSVLSALVNSVSCDLTLSKAQSASLGVRSMPNFASRSSSLGPSRSTMPRVIYCAWLQAQVRLPSNLVAATASTWRMTVDRSNSMRSSFIAPKVFAFVSHRTCRTQSPRRVRSRARALSSIQRTMLCFARTLHLEPCG